MSGGPTPTHLEFDSNRNILYVANYGVNSGGSFSAFKIDSKDGTILENIYNEAYGAGSNVVPDRQKDSHPHAVNIFKNNVYVLDLGCDKIWHYKIDDENKMTKIGGIDTPKGHGPRHMAIYEKLGMAYVIFELECKVGIYQLDFENGNLHFQDSVTTIDKPGW